MSETQALPRFSAPAGEIIGWRDGDVLRATNIPYARARRFQPPERLTRCETPIEATHWAPASPQRTMQAFTRLLGASPNNMAQQEDCTRLSICLPARPATTPRPVMVWIHGGSYVFGAGDLPIHDPKPLVSEQDVVTVSITYRLGIFGFVGGTFQGKTNQEEAKAQGATGDRPANLGLLDMIAALRWISDNIATFGGDPDNVTLFGESAGGDAIAHLMTADETRGLFHRAILQSAPLGITPGRHGMHTAMARAAESLNERSSLKACLDAQHRVEKIGQRYLPGGLMPFGVQFGQPPLPPLDQRHAALEKRAPHCDLLIGHNVDEAELFMPEVEPLQGLFGLPVIGARLRSGLSQRITRHLYSRPAERFARRHAEAGGCVWRYRLNWGSGRAARGACHSIDLALLFAGWAEWQHAGIVEGMTEQELERSGCQLRALWARFARGGTLEDEGAIEGVVEWERVTPS
ncbi:carboxylic ester hydrolase [Kushneria pakistanensis]|uniref:Carboxylic ester hydrolase n=1 Tax=Kushneria pakistanensis TaxID=1508770 RepID=A0ABQ3FPX3_9GAMM|nr:carboxylesterase family protein [Kushneria pakistanensis]GHC33118.1 carboxylic ester hydrolase [Kushneria pakistanensis]